MSDHSEHMKKCHRCGATTIGIHAVNAGREYGVLCINCSYRNGGDLKDSYEELDCIGHFHRPAYERLMEAKRNGFFIDNLK